MRRCLALLAILLAFRFSPRAAQGETIDNDRGLSVSVDAARGEYQIIATDPAWTIGGTTGAPLKRIATAQGTDGVGEYLEISFKWIEENQIRSGSIRLYRSRPIVLLTETFEDSVDHSPEPFPILTKLPTDLLAFRFGHLDHLRPPTFKLGAVTPDEQYGGPVSLFDTSANTIIISPASDFMVAMVSGDQTSGIASGLNATLKSVPAGYMHKTLLAIDRGINHTWDEWGAAVTDLYGKKRPANDANLPLKCLGYWTDNGAAYYYNYDLQKGYEATLLAVRDHLKERGVPIRYMQLDSWWYPKTFTSLQAKESNKPRAKDPRLPAGTWNRYGGLLEYTAHPGLFPDGLAGFQKKLGLPLVTHSRWIDPESPYRQSYKISGVGAVDQGWWNKIIGDIASAGVTTYEQDWLDHIYNYSPEFSTTTTAGEAFMDGMASACAANDVSMQYCMVLPRHVMQGGAKYPNFTTVRVSGDRFERNKWREFIYGSRLPAALGVWPWSDVFKSSEEANLLLSTLSAGMVGISDKIGAESVENIHRAVRGDGVIIKPDAPLLPIDKTFIAEAQGKNSPLVCAASVVHGTDDGANRAAFVFAFTPKPTSVKQDWTLDPKSIGMHADIYAHNFFTGSGEVIESGKMLREELEHDGWSYRILAPIGKSRMALIGDLNAYVTRGKKRIAKIDDDPAGLTTTLLAVPGEKTIDLGIYAPARPQVQVKNGSCGDISYDTATKMARAKIAIDANASPSEVGGDAVIPVEISFTLP